MKRAKKRDYIGLYGNVGIPKAWCEECQANSFVIDGELVCCGTPIELLPERYQRECEPEQRRRTLSPKDKERQLIEQDYKCFYCERTFGSTVFRRGRAIKLKIHYDHMIPYSLCQNNH